ncbi:UPF0280 family protein [Oceaniglobus ichthyenteri]|uniref:UPF0280 family protein n=1 Tax=Oceaniglobus ichthyenteri TaxID=2136177 RepID=UPI000D3354B1|nr:UPF0280 family protein [Oceaniglobus ichthyenteri]
MIAARLPGDRLHLHHGPIDLIIGADGARAAAFAAAQARFSTVLQELADELPLLRQPVGAMPMGAIARKMHAACLPHCGVFVTPMAAVAGAVAETVLAAMAVPGLRRAYVNNGGDIAVFLTPGQDFRLAMAGSDGQDRGRITLSADSPVRGIATSGRGGRSHSLGIADQVTVVAKTAAMADVAATLIANAVDLPAHPAITRTPANQLTPDSDLGARPVVTGLGALCPIEQRRALAKGAAVAQDMAARGLITAAALFLGGESEIIGAPNLIEQKEPTHA